MGLGVQGWAIRIRVRARVRALVRVRVLIRVWVRVRVGVRVRAGSPATARAPFEPASRAASARLVRARALRARG